ncbi:hypothetical protein ACH4Y0_13130 [Streptomyces sp. NPDC020707]|uniref:Uncharacterized protein n=1 Tax=Streptomyces ortus TaxID=2867268 RepID=A0ABT3VAQ7_9ACTN|nr:MULTISPECIES: hypothetical protein [Streptomyces]MCX4235740.1 hypothetical protein [Streptomyces ortus]
MLRSVLVAAFSAVVAFGALSDASIAKSDDQADSHWPAAAIDYQATGVPDSHWPAPPVVDDGSGG